MNRSIAAISAALVLAAPACAGITEEHLSGDAASTGDLVPDGMGVIRSGSAR